MCSSFTSGVQGRRGVEVVARINHHFGIGLQDEVIHNVVNHLACGRHAKRTQNRVTLCEHYADSEVVEGVCELEVFRSGLALSLPDDREDLAGLVEPRLEEGTYACEVKTLPWVGLVAQNLLPEHAIEVLTFGNNAN